MSNTDIKYFLKDYVEQHTEPSRKAGRNMYICPFCGSGNGGNHTGALGLYDNGTRFKCFSCGKNGDIGDFIAELEHITPGEGLQRARALYEGKQPVKIEPVKKETTSAADFTQFIEEAAARADLCDYYSRRGFKPETVAAFKLGYTINGNGYINAVIPVNNYFYMERGTAGEFKRNNGKPAIFNIKDLYNEEGAPVFICEGWADALSVYEGEGYAISTNSAENWRLVIAALKEKPTSNPLIIAFDNDKKGNEAAELLKAALLELGYNSSRFLPASAKDLNEMLTNDREAFINAVIEAEKGAESAKDLYKGEYISAQLDDILNDFRNGKQGAKSTGYKSLDMALGGGLFPGLSVIGAESSHGKSALVMNIAENMAEAGDDVLYFALEMTRAQLVARGLSKQSFLFTGKKTGYTAGEIKQNKAPDIAGAIEAYKKKIANHLIIIENFNGMTAEAIRDRVKQHIAQTGRVPVVVVDYLQMIADNQRQTEKQQTDHSIEILKGISAEHNAHILAISSLNRASYGEPVKMDAFKESGKIEYTADFVLGLSLAATKRGRLTADQIDAEMKKQPRDMMLQVLKGRDIENRQTVELKYYSAYNLFVDPLGDLDEFKAKKAAGVFKSR